MPVTIRQIAQAVGMSIATVGNILGRNGHLYSATTRQRVLAAAQSMGYRPNALARAMRKGHCGNVALLLTTYKCRSAISVPFLDGLLDRLESTPYHLTTMRLPEVTSTEALPKALREWMSDGLLVHAAEPLDASISQVISELKVPTVWIHAQHTVDSVDLDMVEAGRQATRELLERGHRQIAWISGVWSDRLTNSLAWQGHQSLMAQAGLEPRRLYWQHRAEIPALLPAQVTGLVIEGLTLGAEVLFDCQCQGKKFPRNFPSWPLASRRKSTADPIASHARNFPPTTWGWPLVSCC